VPRPVPLGGRGPAVRRALRLGWIIPALFLATLLLCGWRLGRYDHASRLVSELGALGTPTRALFSAGLLLCAALSLPFAAALRRACLALGASPVPILPVLAFTLSIGGAGLFPLPLRLHLLLGLPSILLVLSPLLGLTLWARIPRLRGTRAMAVASLVLMAGGFLAFLPEVLPGLAGVKQRLFHAGWALWFAALAQGFARALEGPPGPVGGSLPQLDGVAEESGLP
jgi:hypothetical membrane protein